MTPALVQLLCRFNATADLPIPQGERLLVFFRIALEHDPAAVNPLTNLIEAYLSPQNGPTATRKPATPFSEIDLR